MRRVIQVFPGQRFERIDARCFLRRSFSASERVFGLPLFRRPRVMAANWSALPAVKNFFAFATICLRFIRIEQKNVLLI